MNLDVHFAHQPPTDFSDVEQALFGHLGIRVGDQELFRLEDKARNVVVDSILTSAYPLALWFAANWWRLRYEPARDSTDWRMSHELQSSGGGYLWPRIAFASDGDEVDIQCHPTLATAYEPVDFFCHAHLKISVGEFESRLDVFLKNILEIANEFGFHDSDFCKIWQDVLKERNDQVLFVWRKLEALVGFDPDDAPKETIQELINFFSDAGMGATEEIAAESGFEAPRIIKELRELRERENEINLATISDFVGARRTARRGIKAGRASWQNGNDTARKLRKYWSLDSGPLSLARQAELFGLPPNLLEDRIDPRGPFAVGLLSSECAGEMRPVLHSKHHTARRFALARLVGDAMYVGSGEKLLPATDSSTSRQKFQRAFAQEFLCPINDLKSFLGTAKPDKDAVNSAASYFDVSPRLVGSALVNHGVVEHDEQYFTG